MRDRVIVIVDRSGSMGGLAQEATTGIREFIKTQQEVKRKTDFMLVEFDDVITTYGPMDIKNMDKYTLVPRSMTALYDAIGKTLVLDGWPKEKYKNNVCLIVTDGHENASREWGQGQIQELIKGLEKEGWEFIFMASNIDAVSTAAGLGIVMGETIQLDNSAKGTMDSYQAGATYSANVRMHGKDFATSQLVKDKAASGSIS